MHSRPAQRPRAPSLLLLLVAFVLLAASGCARSSEHVDVVAIEIDGERATLPLHLGAATIAEDRPYSFHAAVELPDALRGVPVDLSVPLLQAQVSVVADGVALLPHQRRAGYRIAAPQRWRIPAHATADGRLALEFEVAHRWTQSGWLTTIPRVLPAGARDPRADAVELVNQLGNWLAMGALIQIGLSCLLVYFLDRRRRPYLWFGIQAFSAAAYPAFTSGLTIAAFGVWDILIAELGLVLALFASLEFTHGYYELGPVPRWLGATLLGAGLLSLIIVDPYLATQIPARAVVLSVVIATIYQLFVLTRLFVRAPDRRVSVGLLLAAWLALASGTWADLLAWFGVGEPFGGARPASFGLALFALFLSLVLSRSYIRLLSQADQLNHALERQLVELEAERALVVALNQDLRGQVADRSAQLFSALSLISAGDRRRATLAVGSEIDGRYRVERVLGAGAMGMVYEVTRLSDATRWAMKIATGVAGEDLARLAREAHIASKLEHRNVVGIRDIEVSTLGFLYIVLELVDGESLRRRLDRGPLAPAEAAPILAEIARGLAAMHEVGVAHRDLKPDNVLIAAADDGALQVKIADFGISRIGDGTGSSSLPRMVFQLPPEPPRAAPPTPEEATVVEPIDPASPPAAARSSSSSLDLTGTGMLAGTPHYVAPELARGGDPSDVRSDMFSFGVVAFELLTGRRPFAIPVALSLRSGDQPVALEPLGLPPGHEALAALVERCLGFDPDLRPTAVEAAERLEAIAAGEA